ncbi:uncharacterized protein BJX67DRAFT_378167 [Aspergillus lucknowensis]|uniref:Uncharacterized protein n=1 Tax=Aspergillus lucknowensis TaxID=176173 RepID=A0ABR4M293_9EURO
MDLGQRRKRANRGGKRGQGVALAKTRKGQVINYIIEDAQASNPISGDHPRDVETIAILVHSQQPLSYLERLIQAEPSPLKEENGFEKRPGVSFVTSQFEDHPITPRKARTKEKKPSVNPPLDMGVEEVAVADDNGQGY